MKRLITLGIVVTVIAVFAAPVLAEVQNVKVSGDIKTTAVQRDNYTLLPSNRITSGNVVSDKLNTETENFIITQARVRVDADLTDNVSAVVRFLTEYYWDTESNTSDSGDNVDLDLANVTLKEVFYQPLTVTVGRQPLRYGNAFVIGDPDTNTTGAETLDDNNDFLADDLSLRKSFDAIKAVLDYAPYTVDVIFAKIDESGTTDRDENLYGVNVSRQFDSYDAEAEAYWFYYENDTNTAPNPDGGATPEATQRPGNEIHTFGARGSMTPIENLNVLGEIAFQRGDYDSVSATKRDQDALAFQVAGEYALQNFDWNVAVRAGWTHYDGETRDNTGDHEGWIPLFEDQSHGVVANYILGGVNGGQNSNADILNIGATAEPLEDLTLSVDYYAFWLDEKLVSANNTAANNAANGNQGLGWTNLVESTYLMNAENDLGYEVDVALNYDYTEDVRMGLSAGWFVPGDAFEGSSSGNTNEETALQVLATLDVAF